MLLASPLAYAQEGSSSNANEDSVGGARVLEPGQTVATIHATVDDMQRFRERHPNAAHGSTGASGTASALQYHGGTGGIGVETAPQIYLVFWGSQWINGDPGGEAGILEAFYNGVGGSSWLNSVTQYCQGVASGTVFCNGAGTPAGNPVGILAGYWYDNSSAAPSRPKQSQFAAEAARAAAHFGNTTGSSNARVQYVIATAHAYNASGFGTQYCAWHSSTSSSYGRLAYTNLPYITDAGASCGANFNGLGPDAGITIVSGHEMAETMTDQFPSTGWLDSNGAENGDKCAWISSGQGAAATITLPTGTFALQSLWSNAFNSDTGGCVLSY
jgi:serine protease